MQVFQQVNLHLQLTFHIARQHTIITLTSDFGIFER
jgi:hypothetical protein